MMATFPLPTNALPRTSGSDEHGQEKWTIRVFIASPSELAIKRRAFIGEV